MSEIEKMYENAGISKEPAIIPSSGEVIYWKNYPPFTAEKQIELIKWLARKDCEFKLTYEREFLWCSQIEWQSSFCYEKFEESLANLINTLWQDLSSEEKDEIKGILK